MNTLIIEDAKKLCTNIYNYVPPNTEWVIVNIGKTPNVIFTYPSFINITTGFGYSYDLLPQFLMDEHVIEGIVRDRWYTGIATVTSSEPFDVLTPIARAKHYITNKQCVQYYKKWYVDSFSYGPTDCLHAAVLINIQALLVFYTKYSTNPVNQNPTFDYPTGKYSFLGGEVTIDGEIERKTIDLLNRNINSIVSKKDMYEVRGQGKYDRYTATSGKTKVNDISEKIWGSLKQKLQANDILNKVLVFVQKNGFGIFLEQGQIRLLSAPQNVEDNTPKEQ